MKASRSIMVHCMAEWEEGNFLGLDDSAFLEKAAAQGLTLVTYDRRTIPPLLKAWAQEDMSTLIMSGFPWIVPGWVQPSNKHSFPASFPSALSNVTRVRSEALANAAT